MNAAPITASTTNGRGSVRRIAALAASTGGPNP